MKTPATTPREKAADNLVLLPGSRAEDYAVCDPAIAPILAAADGEHSVWELLARLDLQYERAELAGLIRLLRQFSAKFRVRFTRNELEAAIRSLGIGRGDRIVLHTSLSSIGEIEGGAETYCRAWMDVISEDGILLMPSFNFRDEPPKPGEPPWVYDPAVTPSRSGAATECFWRLPGVKRSFSPSHPVAGWGRGVWDLLKDHHTGAPFGENSPLARLEKIGGRAVLVDCPRANSFHHVVEQSLEVRCLEPCGIRLPVRFPDGSIRDCPTWRWRYGVTCPVGDRGREIEEMRRRRLLTSAELGRAEALIFSLAVCRQVTAELLTGPGGCAACPAGRGI